MHIAVVTFSKISPIVHSDANASPRSLVEKSGHPLPHGNPPSSSTSLQDHGSGVEGSATLRMTSDGALSTCDDSTLLDGFSRLLHFFLEEEADYLCGVPRYAQAASRTNYRIGYHKRRLRMRLGVISLRVPHIKYFIPRVSIIKRAKRLSPEIIGSLVRMHASGVTHDEAVALIKNIWTIELPDQLLAALVEKLLPLLESWRATAPTPQRKHPIPCSASSSTSNCTNIIKTETIENQ